ncbi:hypothetical protein AXG93_1658s1050 [Marchantia polymorpha subsp. ruderalis]|uniref:AB hydrolase-1 domain-containing protein n=1 Tax=Marchantia polymorpha subsp. ruderalis TaxID=1480154 RepID=A0A176WL56_MARPO|nr:hypothetical protein AXG93_1658s1050 [Marchantia polymorpha subsp. ruderalis]
MDQIAADAAPAKRTMVFVHGAGHGAWCWYQVVTMMQAAGFNTVTLDLTSAGLDRTPADNVMTISQYAKPLTDFLSDRSSSEPKVVLVGHSLGGVSVSYAMEAHPDKVDKAIFLSALMPQHGETPLEVIGPYFAALLQVGLFKPQQADGSSSPTSVAVNRTVAPSFFYNQSPAEQINLALSLLDDTPLSVFDEVMTLTPKRYGSISRYYILCGMDKTVPFNVQDYFKLSRLESRTFNFRVSVKSDRWKWLDFEELMSTDNKSLFTAGIAGTAGQGYRVNGDNKKRALTESRDFIIRVVALP